MEHSLDAATFSPALVAAAGAVPEYVQSTVSLDAGPLHVADKRLQNALAEGKFPYTILTSHRSQVGWEAAVAFVEKSTASLAFEAEAPRECALFATTKDANIVVGRDDGYGTPSWSITVAAVSRKVARKWADAFARLLPAPPPPPPLPPRPYNMVPVRFWMQNPYSGEATSRNRDIQIHEWSKVEENYSAEPRSALKGLMGLTEPTGGKLLLMHGQPGSGKTRAILTLMSEWREWCAASVITDPEKFLGDVCYMNSLVFGAAGMRDWLLLVIEDGDEFMNVGSRDSKGQSIARLLNLGDGIIGQGLNLLTLITTNVDVEDLNPAVTRNGRCMANIKVGALTADEAGAWLTAKGYKGAKPTEPMTLADMYAKLKP